MKELVTVLMPVYNAERYLAEAIESILHQTYQDFEFLIINDGSSDGSEEIILKYAAADPRINYVKNEHNIKLIATLNKGIKLAKGKYIVRMDADDISVPERIEKQVSFMESHPSVGVCGSYFTVFGEEVKKTYVVTRPLGNETIKASLLFTNSLGHPNVIIRKSVMVDNDIWYDPRFYRIEDWGLWTMLMNKCDFENIPESLLMYRRTPTQETAIGAADPKNFEYRCKLTKENCVQNSIEMNDVTIACMVKLVTNSHGREITVVKSGLKGFKCYIENYPCSINVILRNIMPVVKSNMFSLILCVKYFGIKNILKSFLDYEK